MAYQAILNFEGDEYDVVWCEYTIERQYDSKGRPSSRLFGAKAIIEIESTEDNTIFESMASQFKSNSGTVTFKKDEAEQMKDLSWENGYIVGFEEKMNVLNGMPMKLRFTVSPQTLVIGGETFTQEWPEAS